MNDSWQEIVLQIARHIVVHHQVQKDTAVYVHVFDWRSKPWRAAHRFIEEHADFHAARFVVDMVYEIHSNQVTYQDLSDFAAFSFLAKAYIPASNFRIAFTSACKSDSSIWFQGMAPFWNTRSPINIGIFMSQRKT